MSKPNATMNKKGGADAGEVARGVVDYFKTRYRDDFNFDPLVPAIESAITSAVAEARQQPITLPTPIDREVHYFREEYNAD